MKSTSIALPIIFEVMLRQRTAYQVYSYYSVRIIKKRAKAPKRVMRAPEVGRKGEGGYKNGLCIVAMYCLSVLWLWRAVLSHCVPDLVCHGINSGTVVKTQ